MYFQCNMPIAFAARLLPQNFKYNWQVWNYYRDRSVYIERERERERVSILQPMQLHTIDKVKLFLFSVGITLTNEGCFENVALI